MIVRESEHVCTLITRANHVSMPPDSLHVPILCASIPQNPSPAQCNDLMQRLNRSLSDTAIPAWTYLSSAIIGSREQNLTASDHSQNQTDERLASQGTSEGILSSQSNNRYSSMETTSRVIRDSQESDDNPMIISSGGPSEDEGDSTDEASQTHGATDMPPPNRETTEQLQRQKSARAQDPVPGKKTSRTGPKNAESQDLGSMSQYPRPTEESQELGEDYPSHGLDNDMHDSMETQAADQSAENVEVTSDAQVDGQVRSPTPSASQLQQEMTAAANDSTNNASDDVQMVDDQDDETAEEIDDPALELEAFNWSRLEQEYHDMITGKDNELQELEIELTELQNVCRLHPIRHCRVLTYIIVLCTLARNDR